METCPKCKDETERSNCDPKTGECYQCWCKRLTEAAKGAAPSGQSEFICCTALVAEEKGCWIVKERNQLLALTKTMECHPEDYDGPCECQTCVSYGG
jgi:hypothetical protein